MATNPFAVDAGNDFSSGLSGLSATMANIRQSRMIEAERQRQLDAQEEQKQRFADAQAAANKAFASGDPQEMLKASIQYPEISDNILKSMGINDEIKRRDAGEFAKNLLMASPDQRSEIYQQRIQDLQDQGRDASHTVQSFKNYQRNPNGELQALETVWAGAYPQEYQVIADQHKAAQRAALEEQKQRREDMRFERAEAGRNQRAYARSATGGGAGGKLTANRQDFEYYQDLKKTDPVAATEFGRQAGFVSKEGKELSPQVQKRLSTATDDAIAAENNTAKFTNLANEIEKSGLSGGLLGGSVSEKLKELTGEQDAISNLRREYNAIKASQVVSNLPPGAASDKDIELAMGGFPSDRANKQQLSGFLRGLAKLQKANADLQNFKADYISSTGSERGMLKAWKEQSKGGAKAKSAPAPAAQSSDGWEIIQ
nr:hypothetical protein [uncultured Pseudomonas sp.]